MEKILKEIVLWGGLAIFFFWLQTSHLLDFFINPNWLILGLVLAWGVGKFFPAILFTVCALGIYLWTLPFSFWPVLMFLITGILMGIVVRFLTGKPLVDEALLLGLGIIFLNLLFFWNSGSWFSLNVLWEILVTEFVLFLGWPIFSKIK